MVELQVPEVDYTRYSNRQLASIPLAVLVLALLIIAGWYVTTGAPVTPGMEFTGGTEMRIQTDVPQSEVPQAFEEDVSSVTATQSSGNAYIVQFQSTNTDTLSTQAQQAGFEVVSVQTTSASFGAESQRLALYGIVAAFVGMSVLVFLMFRSFVPSIAVVLSAFSDIVIPVALMNVLGIKLSLGTVTALLMLIGYSVDSDILLNNHILRRSGDFYESTYRAMRTGVTMTVTSISAMAVMALVAAFFQVDLLRSIGVVLVLGLATDLMNTYMLNLSLLRWYKFEGVAR
ncbi:protein translocase subunit SecF [Halomicrococcus gelatinilyticus]|uniref:protein translocase subunit SecF n=1 Tax=Halomicrococcus gelatinilyticus TaxID=1702103 RepID=UPI002E10E2BD